MLFVTKRYSIDDSTFTFFERHRLQATIFGPFGPSASLGRLFDDWELLGNICSDMSIKCKVVWRFGDGPILAGVEGNLNHSAAVVCGVRPTLEHR